MSSAESSDEDAITSSKGKASTSSRKRQHLASDSSDQGSDDESKKPAVIADDDEEDDNENNDKGDKDKAKGSSSDSDSEELTALKKKPILEDDDESSDDDDEDAKDRSGKKHDKILSSDDDDAGKSEESPKKAPREKSKGGEKAAKKGKKKKVKKSKSKEKKSKGSDAEEEDGDADESSGSSEDSSLDSDAEEDEEGNKMEQKADDGSDSSDDDLIPEDDEGDNVSPTKPGVIYDFDIMMAKKKEENSRKRRRRGYDIINDNDDIIADIINQMKDAVEADIEANKTKQVATAKLKLLPFIMNQLRKVDLRDAFLDSDVLSVITDWLAPLPDRSLPHLNIRENLLKILIDFNLYDVDRIKSSGIGKAVMYLYKHPKETKENKQRAKLLISNWSRPIFNLDSSFSAISREEREERDKELQRRASGGDGATPKRLREEPAQPVAKNPGDKGWIPRARVPAPSMRDYVIRPRSKVDGDIGKGSKRPSNVLEKLMKTHQERRRANKQQRAVNMKIDKA